MIKTPVEELVKNVNTYIDGREYNLTNMEILAFCEGYIAGVRERYRAKV